MPGEPETTWTHDARQRLEKLPEAMRERARLSAEEIARRAGASVVTAAHLDEAEAPRWPIVAGRFVVGDPGSPVAVCTLASSDLVDRFADQRETAIVGRLYTMNLGLEKLVWNVVSNPAIRYLILCGQDSQGVSEAIVNLHDKGIDDERRIRDARGYQPYLYNLTEDEIAAFQQHVEIIDRVGVEDVDEIIALARGLRARASGPWGEGARHSFPEPAAAVRNRMGDTKLDALGMFLVGLRRSPPEIVLDHYGADRRYQGTIVGTDAEAICHTLVREGLLSELSHAAYLGREVAKAEEALRSGLEYEQDRLLFPPGQGGPWAPFGQRLRPADAGLEGSAAPRRLP